MKQNLADKLGLNEEVYSRTYGPGHVVGLSPRFIRVSFKSTSHKVSFMNTGRKPCGDTVDLFRTIDIPQWFTMGAEVEVSNDGKEWERRIAVVYLPKAGYKFVCFGGKDLFKEQQHQFNAKGTSQFVHAREIQI